MPSYEQDLADIDELFSGDEQRQLSSEQSSRFHDALRQLPDGALERHDAAQRRKFLYFAAAAYDRWSVPTPVVVEAGSDDQFVDIVTTYRRLAPNDVNLLLLTLHELLTSLWTQFAVHSVDCPPNLTVDAEGAAVIEHVIARAAALPYPVHPQIQRAVEECRARVLSLARAIGDGTVTTVLTTSLPHAAVRAPFEGTGTWRGLGLTYALVPEARTAAGMTAVGDAVVSVEGRTRDEAGTCQVTVTLRALVDHNAWTPHLTASDTGPGPIHSGQPLSQTLLYHLLHDLLSYLQDQELPSVDQWWAVAPRDITQLGVQVNAGAHAIVNIPMLMMAMWRVETGRPRPQHVDVPELLASPYWTMSRRQARGYLSLGSTREALLWLNMAVEALLDERIDVLTHDRPELHERLTTSKLLFADAEDALVAGDGRQSRMARSQVGAEPFRTNQDAVQGRSSRCRLQDGCRHVQPYRR